MTALDYFSRGTFNLSPLTIPNAEKRARITTKGHQAQQVFQKDVRETYEKLRNRARELAEERAKNPEGAGVETIQLQAVEPGTSINIQVPPPNHEDPAIQHARKIFESFPPGLQRALESGSLDEVNKVLGKMSVEEAEEVVEKLGEVCKSPPFLRHL